LLAALIRFKNKPRKSPAAIAGGTEQAAEEVAAEVAAQKLTTYQSLLAQSQVLANLLVMKRFFVSAETINGNTVLSLDPRFLVFEFTHNILLRRSQVALVNQFIKRVSEGTPMVSGTGMTQRCDVARR
jgi:hypothetical protein